MSEVDYKGYYSPLTAVPDDVMTEWETVLKGERARILAALQEKITNADEFITKLANPASEAWASFVNPDYADAEFLKLKHRVKLKSAFDSWNTGVANAFAEGGTFEINVTNKKDKFQKARYPMGAVGLRYLMGWGPAYKAMGYITGDKRVAIYLTGDDTASGEPTNIFPTRVVKYVRPMGIAIFTQGLVLAYYAHEAGLTTERDAVITEVNSKFDDSVEKLVDTTLWTNVEVEIGYDSIADRIYAHVHAEPVT